MVFQMPYGKHSWLYIAGGPGDDPRLLAVLPSHVVSAALERAVLQDGSPAVQASHVGLIYNLAKRVQHTKGGGDWNSGESLHHVDLKPWRTRPW